MTACGFKAFIPGAVGSNFIIGEIVYAERFDLKLPYCRSEWLAKTRHCDIQEVVGKWLA